MIADALTALAVVLAVALTVVLALMITAGPHGTPQPRPRAQVSAAP